MGQSIANTDTSKSDPKFFMYYLDENNLFWMMDSIKFYSFQLISMHRKLCLLELISINTI